MEGGKGDGISVTKAEGFDGPGVSYQIYSNFQVVAYHSIRARHHAEEAFSVRVSNEYSERDLPF